MTKRLVFAIRPTFRQIANTLKREQGWDIYGFHAANIPDHFRDSCSGTLDLHAVIQNAKASPVPDDITLKCKVLEEEYGLNLSDVISADRHLGIGWVTGGLYHRGGLSFMPFEKHLQIVHEVFMAFREFFEQVKPTFVCADQVGSFVGAVLYAVCAKDGIPIYSLISLEHDFYYYWQRERTGAVPGLAASYENQKLSHRDPEDTYEYVEGSVRGIAPAMLEKGKYSRVLRTVIRDTKNHVIRKIVGKDKRTGDIYLRTRIAYIIRNCLGFRKEMRRQYEPITQIADSDYVYYPLHYEPEASLSGLEPHFTNQMYAVELLSKSVPVGVDVRVKEHPGGIGNRPSHWMDTIAQFPHVKLVNPLESSIELIRNSLATATIAGTAGLEAALLGKPVISLGPNYRFNFVDHVWHGNDLMNLRGVIKQIYLKKDRGAFRRNGANLIKAIEMTCFKLDEHIAKVKNPPEPAVEVASNELIRLVNEGEAARSLSPAPLN